MEGLSSLFSYPELLLSATTQNSDNILSLMQEKQEVLIKKPWIKLKINDGFATSSDNFVFLR